MDPNQDQNNQQPVDQGQGGLPPVQDPGQPAGGTTDVPPATEPTPEPTPEPPVSEPTAPEAPTTGDQGGNDQTQA